MFPTTESSVNIWIFVSIVLYLFICYLWSGLAKKRWKVGIEFLIPKLFNGANLGVCSLLAPSLVNGNIINLLGQSPLYLTIAGLVGVFISICQIGAD